MPIVLIFSIRLTDADVGLDKSAYRSRIKLSAWLVFNFVKVFEKALGDVCLREGCKSVQISRR